MAQPQQQPQPGQQPQPQPQPQPAPQPAQPTPAPAGPTPPQTGVRLYAPDHPNGCHIALLNGTTFMVPHEPEGALVPKAFRREAIARGCFPVGTEPEAPLPETFDRAMQIRSKMEEMLGGTDKDSFDGSGKPNLSMLSKLCGFTVERTERDKLWAEVEAGLN